MTVMRTMIRLAMVLSALLVFAGCRSPHEHADEADRAAYQIIAEKSDGRLGTEGTFSVAPPAEQLRRRLLREQALPVGFRASAGTRDLELIPEIAERNVLRGRETAAADLSANAPWLTRAGAEALVLSLNEALQVAARNNRDYRRRKEGVFRAALDLDLERDAFRSTWQGILSGEIESDLSSGDTESWSEGLTTIDVQRLFKSGARMTARLGINLVQLLAGGSNSSLGVFGDGSINVPLMRGSGRFVVTEPMKQAERDVAYAICEFERFRRSFAVQVASEYLGVLQQRDRVRNTEENYRGLVASARRARRLADMGRLPEIQVDQAVQDELRARDRWIAARQALERGRDGFKQLLGLPVDAEVVPDPDELESLSRLSDQLGKDKLDDIEPQAIESADAPINLDAPTREDGGRYEIEPRRAIRLALDHRLDFRVALGRIDDAQRAIVLAADDLRADLELLGGVTVGERRSRASADEPNAQLRFDRGAYRGLLSAELPFERTAERNRYRVRWLDLEEAVRNVQRLEDQIKFEVRDQLRVLLEAREAARIQMRAVEVARRRVRGTELFLEQGRAEIRDVLEARESLVSAENARTAAIVRYRVAELQFQRDLGVLQVDARGLWAEYDLNSKDGD